MTGDAIYLLQPDDQLVELRQQGYVSEEFLQGLLARYPSLLAGEQLTSTAPRRWLLVRREAGIADDDQAGARWTLDHLFLDQEAIPTLVEVKRSLDTRIRREVVGQMLDYAANSVAYLPIERIQSWFEARCAADGRATEEVRLESLGPDIDPDAFWAQARTNLQAGRIRLLFVADSIPPELRRIVEFLNRQMSPAEVLAVEVRQYVGGALKTLVPRLIGATAEAERAKGSAARPPTKRWDQQSFLSALDEQIVPVARRLLQSIHERGLRVRYGTGAVEGTMAAQLIVAATTTPLFVLYTTGRMEIPLGAVKSRRPFEDEAMRSELVQRFRQIPGLQFSTGGLDGYPKFDARLLKDPDALATFLDTVDWAIVLLRQNAEAPVVE